MQNLTDQARSAPPARLSRQIPSARLPFLEGALDNPRLAVPHVLQILRNPAVTATVLERIAGNRAWLRAASIRSALAVHPRTPRVIAVLLLPSLGWRELARVSEASRVDPQVRRLAERRLASFLDELAQGERISLARIARPGLFPSLCMDDSSRVIDALLRNPRLLENDVLKIVTRRSAPGPVLKTVSENPRFGRRREVQKALARHPNTPSPVALRLLHDLRPRELREVARAPRLPRLIKVAASRLLERGTAPGRARRGRNGAGRPD